MRRFLMVAPDRALQPPEALVCPS